MTLTWQTGILSALNLLAGIHCYKVAWEGTVYVRSFRLQSDCMIMMANDLMVGSVI